MKSTGSSTKQFHIVFSATSLTESIRTLEIHCNCLSRRCLYQIGLVLRALDTYFSNQGVQMKIKETKIENIKIHAHVYI